MSTPGTGIEMRGSLSDADGFRLRVGFGAGLGGGSSREKEESTVRQTTVEALGILERRPGVAASELVMSIQVFSAGTDEMPEGTPRELAKAGDRIEEMEKAVKEEIEEGRKIRPLR